MPRGRGPGYGPTPRSANACRRHRQASPGCSSGGRSDGSGFGLVLDALVGEQRLELARLEHLGDDVAAANELALHIELRHRRPLRELLDALAQLVILEHVRRLERYAHVREDL